MRCVVSQNDGPVRTVCMIYWRGCHGDSGAMIGSAFQGMIHTHTHTTEQVREEDVCIITGAFGSTGAQANNTRVMLTLDLCFYMHALRIQRLFDGLSV